MVPHLALPEAEVEEALAAVAAVTVDEVLVAVEAGHLVEADLEAVAVLVEDLEVILI